MSRSEYVANKELAQSTKKVLTKDTDLLTMRKPAKVEAKPVWVYNPYSKTWQLV